MRGLVTWPGVTFTKDHAFHLDVPADAQLTRTWLLFWDRIVVPWTGLIEVEWGEDIDCLIAKGAIEERRIPGSPGSTSEVMKDGRLWLFETMEAQEPGAWAVGTGSFEDEISIDHKVRGLRVSLVNALPVPDQEVPLDDILAFRSVAQDEREALMSHLDELYLSIANEPDRPLAERYAISKLARGARDILRRTEEQKFPYRLANLTADFNLLGASLAASTSIALGASWPQIVGNSVLAGASITVGRTLGLIATRPAPTPFKYIVSYSKDVFRPE